MDPLNKKPDPDTLKLSGYLIRPGLFFRRRYEIKRSSMIEYTSYAGEHHSPLIIEPYSIFTYRYFVYLWPQLCFLVLTKLSFVVCLNGLADESFSVKAKCIGTVMCKMGRASTDLQRVHRHVGCHQTVSWPWLSHRACNKINKSDDGIWL
ncbi:unnamed protein product [Brassica oleracea var. botrytis]|uniref:Uncharacterized protein n=1 Tax=Brassica oleracea TaxID=3712 RepID=A0A3P6BHE9_BRAOL|nr:unnamed protein product [Brassica oleracea]